ncbi:hypothetical protein Goshw_020193 [Gossypium schwendimanii]|uniref:Uncharacterized protein n=1 Tax=Gossypium schwendimanii TaxID=34291 RepID=A0A7J9MUP5_GOSSC|nr:hypothetical protein [Gossypium schwendimanii]
MVILQNLSEEDVKWRALWLLPDEILQYRSRQFIHVTHELVECEFSYKGDGYKNKIREMSNAWNLTRWMKRLAVGPMITPEYNEWWVRIINDNIPELSHENKLEKKIEQMEEENMNLRLDVDVQKLEAEKLRKGKTKAEKDLDSLKTDYKKLRLSMRTVGLGKTSEQWREKIQEEKDKPIAEKGSSKRLWQCKPIR